MNQNISKLLSAAMVVGLLAGSTCAIAKDAAKKGTAKKAAAEKHSCKGHAKKAGKKDACSGKDGCKGEDHHDEAGAAPAPTEGGEAAAE